MKKSLLKVMAAAAIVGTVVSFSSVLAMAGTYTWVYNDSSNTLTESGIVSAGKGSGTAGVAVEFTDGTSFEKSSVGYKLSNNTSFKFESDAKGTLTIYARGNTGASAFTGKDSEGKALEISGSVLSNDDFKKTDNHPVTPVVVNLEDAGEYTITNNGGSQVLVLKMVLETEESTEVINLESLAISPETAEVYAGKTVKFSAVKTPSNATGTASWVSSNTSVATVSANGTVTGVAEGDANITVTIDGKSATGKVTVKAKPVVKASSTGSASDIVAPKTTTTYDVLSEAANIDGIENNDSAYTAGSLYFNDAVFAVTDLPYRTDKKHFDIDSETAETGGIGIKGGTWEAAVKLAPGSTVDVAGIGGGSGSRYLLLASKAGITSKDNEAVLNSSETVNSSKAAVSYTNEGTADEIVYISATNEVYISQIKITASETETAPELTLKGVGNQLQGTIVNASAENQILSILLTLDPESETPATKNVTKLRKNEDGSFYFNIAITNTKNTERNGKVDFTYTSGSSTKNFTLSADSKVTVS